LDSRTIVRSGKQRAKHERNAQTCNLGIVQTHFPNDVRKSITRVQQASVMNWREGYDYPSDDEEQDDDFMERADYDYERINDK